MKTITHSRGGKESQVVVRNLMVTAAFAVVVVMMAAAVSLHFTCTRIIDNSLMIYPHHLFGDTVHTQQPDHITIWHDSASFKQ